MMIKDKLWLRNADLATLDAIEIKKLNLVLASPMPTETESLQQLMDKGLVGIYQKTLFRKLTEIAPKNLLLQLKKASTTDLAGYICQHWIKQHWKKDLPIEGKVNTKTAIALTALQTILLEENCTELANELHYRCWLVDQWLGFEVCYLDATLQLDPIRTKLLLDFGFKSEDIENYKNKWRKVGIDLV